MNPASRSQLGAAKRPGEPARIDLDELIVGSIVIAAETAKAAADHRPIPFICSPNHTPTMDRLTYIGHATTLLRLDGVSVLTDPMLRRWLGPLRRQGLDPEPDVAQNSDVVLISHLHRDHLDIPSLRRLPPSTPLAVPRGAACWAACARRRRGRAGNRAGEAVSVAGVEAQRRFSLFTTDIAAAIGGDQSNRSAIISAGGRTVYPR